MWGEGESDFSRSIRGIWVSGVRWYRDFVARRLKMKLKIIRIVGIVFVIINRLVLQLNFAEEKDLIL